MIMGLLEEPMTENMVFTVEPGIYLPEKVWYKIGKMML
ncbi:MAG: hypothetical protein CM15mP36_16660 [Flavobacteriales bacterium]|nr:MAG: hypothetical protein CM15mP36_16660 [Flavobacteriales bacterium]